MAEPAVASAQDVPEGFCLVRDHGDLHVKSVFMALVNCPLGVEALLLVLECDFETVSRREQEPSKDRRHAGRPAHDTQAQGGRPLQFVPCEGAHCRQCQSATRRSDGLAQGRLGRSARVKNTKKLFLCPDCLFPQIGCLTFFLLCLIQFFFPPDELKIKLFRCQDIGKFSFFFPFSFLSVFFPFFLFFGLTPSFLRTFQRKRE